MDKEVYVRNQGRLAMLVVALLFVSLAPLAAAPVMVGHGIDVFTTIPSGGSHYDFSTAPIPAGFFCKTSKPFTGRVALTGLPLETAIPGQLRGADTVVERLDDAIFDAKGTAVTRVQLRALSLVSVSPIKTSCGSYHVYITLAGEQRPTIMKIHRTQESGGTFEAPIAADAHMTFVPVKGRNARKLELTGSFNFAPSPIPWSFEGTGPRTKRIGAVKLDTNGDLIPDTLLSGTSNFAAGWAPGAAMTKVIGGNTNCVLCEPSICHSETDTKAHCTGGVYACNGTYCP
jgi:hypothetical protein